MMRFPHGPIQGGLERRLETLAIEAPPFTFSSLARRRPPVMRRGRRRRLAAIAVAVPASLLIVAAADPSGILEVSREALQAAGLTQSQVVPLSGQARHGSTVVRVTGAYSDDLDTVVFAEIDLPPGVGLGADVNHCAQAAVATESCQQSVSDVGIYLVDQFGQRYGLTGGMGLGVGPYPMSFAPLTGRAAREGARLSLHMRFVDGANTTSPKPFELVIPLSGRLAPKPAKRMAAPAPVVDQSRGVSYSIIDLEYSQAYLEVHTRLAGNLANVVTRQSGPNLSGTTYPGVFLVDSSGVWLKPLVVSGPGRAVITNSVQDETRMFAVKPGTYRIVVDKAGGENPGSGGDVILAEWTVTVP